MNAAGQIEQVQIFEAVKVQHLDDDLRQFITSEIWPHSSVAIDDLDGFFKFVASIKQDISWSCPSHLIETVFAATTYGELKKVFASLRASVSKPKQEIISALEQEFPAKSREQCEHILEFAAGIWTTLPLEISSQSVRLNDDDVIEWADDTSLQSLARVAVPKYCAPSGIVQSLESVLLDQQLTAARLSQVCRVGVEWTDNLAAHLEYDVKSDKLLIYPHKAFLEAHLASLEATPPPGFALDKEVLVETIRTLDLLLPPNPRTRRFLANRHLTYHHGRPRKWPNAIDLTEFVYWRSRLARLQALFNRPPTTLPAMWYDRRQPLQWMTFWLAGLITILTVVFGLISSYAAFKQVELAQKAYDLSLTQACMASAVPQRFCGAS